MAQVIAVPNVNLHTDAVIQPFAVGNDFNLYVPSSSTIEDRLCCV